MKKTVSILLVLLLVVVVIWIVSELRARPFENKINEDTLELINNMTNEDVVWDGTFFGLMPKLEGATIQLQDTKYDVNPLLVDALLDQDKFVAAHILLSYRTASAFRVDGSRWNGLEVQLKSNGQVSYDGNDLNELWKYWTRKLGN